MNRKDLETYITESYNADPEILWQKYPNYTVFRHSNNRKWFAVIMDVPKEKLGLKGHDKLDILNVKCDPLIIGSLRGLPGYYPAYHMSKATWLSVALDGSVKDEDIKFLLDVSFELTDVSSKGNKL